MGNPFETLEGMHQSFHYNYAKQETKTCYSSRHLFSSEIPAAVVPPIPVLLPLPDEKKPPAKRVEGIVCLSSTKTSENRLYCARVGKFCLMQHIRPLVVSSWIASKY